MIATLRDLRREIKRLEADLAKYSTRSPEWSERLKARIAVLEERVREEEGK